jgi:phospholipid/cholesterol/gamma-HCH transport system substrate-binding protein
MPSAQRVKWAKIRSASVCVTAAAILMVLFYLLSGGTLFEEKATLYLYVNDATGITIDSPVRVDGIGVGKVTKLELTGLKDPNSIVRITMTVERDRLPSIPADSWAQLSADTVVGDKYVDIQTGRSSAHVTPDSTVEFKPQADLFKTIDIPQLEAQLRTADALLGQIEQGKGPVGQLVVSDEIYNKLRLRLAEINSAVQKAADTTGLIGQALYTDKLHQQIRAPIVEIDQALARIQSGQGTGGQLLRDTAQYEQLRDLIRNLGQSVADVHQSEFLQSDRLYTEWNRNLAGLIQTVDAVNAGPMFTTSEMYDNLNGFAREMRDTVKDFRQDPRKFLRLRVF